MSGVCGVSFGVCGAGGFFIVQTFGTWRGLADCMVVYARANLQLVCCEAKIIRATHALGKRVIGEGCTRNIHEVFEIQNCI